MDEIGFEPNKRNPEQKAGVISKFFFWFTFPLLRLGSRKSLEITDLYKVMTEDESRLLSDQLDEAWEKEVAISKKKSRVAKLHNAIYNVFGVKYSLLGLILICEEFIKIIQPLCMGRLIRYFRFCSETTLNEAYFYAFGFSMCAVMLAFWHHPYFYHVLRVGMQIRVAVGGLIYRKILNVNLSDLREMEAGKIVNMLSNDVARFDQTVVFLHYFWAAPLSLIGFVILLWYEMGPSCLVGFGALILLVPVQGYMGRKMGYYRRQIATFTDKRISFMNELLNGIRVIKMYAWETPFAQLVEDIRKQEMRKFQLQSIFQGMLVGLFFVTGKLIVLCALVAYILMGNTVGAELVFVASALYNSVRLTLTLFLPFAIQFYSEYKVTLSRIEKFLFLTDKEKVVSVVKNGVYKEGKEELKPEMSLPLKLADDDSEFKVEMTKYSAKWSEKDQDNALQDIDLRIKRGQLVIVVGPVGAGKTTLLQCLCGETRTSAGSVNVRGRFVYVPQESWIFPASVRQNVIFGRQIFDAKRYYECLDVCQMHQDIETFPHGDATVVGDKGSSLSGGQKARINLARAIYYGADIYLLDDPISAVDANVGRLIFEKCIMGHLADGVRILVTHQLQYLKYADLVVVMKGGRIAASGTYKELEQLGENFTSILRETLESYELRQKTLSVSSSTSVSPNLNRKLSNTNNDARDDDDDDDDQNNVVMKGVEKSIKFVTDKEDKKSTLNEDSTADTAGLTTNIKKSIDEKFLLLKNGNEKEEDDRKSKIMAQIEDEKTGGIVNWNAYVAYFRHMGNCFTVVLLFIFCIFVQVVFNFSDWWLNIWATSEDAKRFSDYLNNSSDSFMMLNCSYSSNNMSRSNQSFMQPKTSDYGLTSNQYLYWYAGIIGFLTLISLLRSVTFRVMLNRSSLKLHSKMFSAVLRAPLLFFDRNPTGRILNRFSKDTGTMDELLSFVTFDFLQGIIMFFGIILVVGLMNPVIFIFTIPLMALFVYARTFYMKTGRVIKRLEASTKSPVYSHVTATLSGLTSIRSYGAERHVFLDFHRHQNTHTSVYSAFLSTGRWFSLVIDWQCSIFITIVAFVSVWTAENGQAGQVGLSLFYASTLMILFSRFLNQSVTFEASMVSVERILEYANLASEKEDKTLIIPNRTWPQRGAVDFGHVNMSYGDEGHYVLKDLSFHIKPAEKIGIVGRTGAGKSSVLNALLRLSKVDGQITIDDLDTRTISLKDLRKKISIIPQDPVLFMGSLRKNLDPFNEFTDYVIWNALENVELKNVFKGYEQGLQSQMQEGGANLSVGQRQLVCLARALLRQNKILIIDEATANVDLHTDSLIQRTIRHRFKECTVLTIAHRLNTIMDCDRVMVMEAGRLTEMDKPATLLDNEESLFSKLVAETGHQNAALLRKIAQKAANASSN